VIVDAHVHFWDPGTLHYPWLDEIPALKRAFLPADYRAAVGNVAVSKVLFVEANCRADETLREVAMIERLAETEPTIAGIVAFEDLTAGLGVGGSGLGRSPLVKGVRQNIQGQPAGFCVQPAFVDGVREVGRRGLTFDLCATHDQLRDVVQLVRLCPSTRFVLDHCGKPAIKEGRAERWRTDIAALAVYENVACKMSGLLTQAAPEAWNDEDLLPYADWVIRCFGTQRVLYGSDWPVLTLAGSYCDWYGFTQAFTATWTAAERDGFYGGNAVTVYGL